MRRLFIAGMVALVATVGCHRRSGDDDGGSPGSTTPDTTRPTVISTNPVDGDPDVAVNRKIDAYFSEAMLASTISSTTFTLTGPGTTPVTGVVSYDPANHAVRFLPSISLAFSTLFTATISTGVQDLSGNSMAASYVWTFTTGLTSDSTAPSVTSTIPLSGATGVPLNTKVTATFDEPMDPSTFTTATFTFTLQSGTTPVSGTVVCPSPGTSASFIPDSDLAPSTIYTATVTTGVKDLAGNALLFDYVWSFTTGTSVMAGQANADLKSADGFAVLAGTTVSNTGPTAIYGDVGLSPGSAIVGFPPGVVYGTIYGPGTISDTAKTDLTTAYVELAGRSTGVISCPSNLGGLTLAPGLYKSSSPVIISGTGPLGILTLDAQGDANAVWVFQLGSSLITDPATSVVLSGGALARNIYWQVSSSATLDTTCKFKGNILAEASISLKTGATLDGRALTQSAAVTLESNTITKP
ncbi:MAG: ice-binding family protein [Planctomycetota bacterium]